MITDEMVKLAWAIAVTGRPVGAGDGCGTVTVEPPTLANMRKALEAVAPMILEEAAKVAEQGQCAELSRFSGYNIARRDTAAAIRAMKEKGHD